HGPWQQPTSYLDRPISRLARAHAEVPPSGGPLPAIPFADCRNEVFAERALEIVLRREPPILPRRRIVDRGRPRIDDPLPLLVDIEADARVGKRGQDHVADFGGRRVEG